MATDHGGNGPPRPSPPLAGTALVVAVAVIVVWLGLLVWLGASANMPDVAWSRRLVVLGSVETVAFAAVGALFGTTIQRQRVADLAAQRDAALSRADAHEAAAINGEKLAVAVRTARASTAGSAAEQLTANGQPGSDPVLQLANLLFPE
jgi:hypothetical protein